MENKKIMIVDDEVGVLALLERKLAAAGYQVIKATRGREAVAKAKIFWPDLIVMDIMLPDLEGPEAVKLIKEDPLAKGIRVLFLSGIVTQDKTGDHRSEVTAGGQSYRSFAKPFDSDSLLEEVRKILA